MLRSSYLEARSSVCQSTCGQSISQSPPEPGVFEPDCRVKHESCALSTLCDQTKFISLVNVYVGQGKPGQTEPNRDRPETQSNRTEPTHKPSQTEPGYLLGLLGLRDQIKSPETQANRTWTPRNPVWFDEKRVKYRAKKPSQTEPGLPETRFANRKTRFSSNRVNRFCPGCKHAKNYGCLSMCTACLPNRWADRRTLLTLWGLKLKNYKLKVAFSPLVRRAVLWCSRMFRAD